MKFRAFRFVVIELFKIHVKKMGSYDEMECWFSQLGKKSVLAHQWIKKFIKTLFLILLHVRTQREGEFDLRLFVCK